jgi:hypothetical protein
MGFSNQERINLFTKALAAGVYDANATAVWYESKFPFTFILSGTSIWTNLSGVPIAGNLATARSNASANPTIIQDKSQNADAIRLTLVAGTNNSTYAAYSTYNDTTSDVLKNWILPQLVPQTSGAPSNGYAIALYDGNPNSGGTLVTTTEGTTGTGINKTVGWIFNYASGILILADDFSSSISDPYILGFRYIGSTAEDTSSTNAEKVQNAFTADETIATTELVRFVNSSDSGLTPGRVMKARSSELVTGEFCGIASSGGGQGDSINVVTEGKVSVKFSSSVASANNGKAVYISDVDGIATTVAPSTPTNAVYKIGTLVGADGSTSTPIVKLSFQEIIIIG